MSTVTIHLSAEEIEQAIKDRAFEDVKATYSMEFTDAKVDVEVVSGFIEGADITFDVVKEARE